ncbi:MAG: PilZ domain-containing protein [Planctomycetes bacterium]|nr:PilZ domain-containing protein [Planctomycetota bacterium]
MRALPGSMDLRGCVTEEGLGRLFDNAFEAWRPGETGGRGRRETPRVPARGTAPLFVVSYAFAGRETELNRPAPIADISADGLGITLPEPIPVGAVLCFAFEDADRKQHHGIAEVVRSMVTGDDYKIGLTFAEKASALDVEPSTEDTEPVPATPGTLEQTLQRLGLDRLRQAASAAFGVLTRRRSARRELRKSVYDAEAVFVVEARRFRYAASLSIDGKRVAGQTGALRDRLRSLLCPVAVPTLVHLEGGGFSAWAALRANTVNDCNLDLSVALKKKIFAAVQHADGKPPIKFSSPES